MCNMHTHGMAASQETSADEPGARVAPYGMVGHLEHVVVWQNVVQHDMDLHYKVWHSPPQHDTVRCAVAWLSTAWHCVTWGWMVEQQLREELKLPHSQCCPPEVARQRSL